MSSSQSHCTCTCSCTTTESVTKNGETVERTTHIDSQTNPDGKQHIATTVTDVTIDPEGHKTITTHTNTQVGDTPALH